ncbi:MAG: hypothetical protein GXW99_05260 [Clostridiales bacterium]|nr:hypothetical protein [Clostridiales bacterium]
MMLSRVSVEMDGIEEVKELIEKAQEQIDDLSQIVEQISAYRIGMHINVNQPPAATDD